MDHRIIATYTKNWYSRLDMGKMLADVFYYEDQDELIEQVPFKMEVCPTCNGTGFYVNPNIDSNGITQDEWNYEWAHDEKEAYISGEYDAPCATCNGNCVVPVVDQNRATQEQIALVEKVIAIHTEYAVERANEIKYGY